MDTSAGSGGGCCARDVVCCAGDVVCYAGDVVCADLHGEATALRFGVGLLLPSQGLAVFSREGSFEVVFGVGCGVEIHGRVVGDV